VAEDAEQGAHQDEYDDGMVELLELVWGKGFMSPGGPDNVKEIVAGLDLAGKLVLDIGCGVGGPALVLAGELGARVIGFDLEAPLIARAQANAREAGLEERVEFRRVDPGPLPLEDASVDTVFTCGCFIHVDDKPTMFREVSRVLRPGGALACYDWMKGDEPYSADMRYWFKMEGLTYAMETLETYGRLLEEAGFTEVEMHDDSQAYRDLAHREYEAMQGPLKARMIEVLGQELQEYYLENWHASVIVLDRGELKPGFCRGIKPA
jgi:phosphoethanolamine N-methyltransferase